ncbi:Hypothetical predicted protein [Cloeon dipterum]|uniref:Uncharacterized protein n=1 Tax=Cloeon dipterum TaxID=197152 RepID=A0A8S1DMW4_9INSE|nr:Hypothetical predicted protein [Cloeon dipterum]
MKIPIVPVIVAGERPAIRNTGSAPTLMSCQPDKAQKRALNAMNEAYSNQVFFVRRSRWPDYHYLFPWDYKTSEYGAYESDWTSWLIGQAAGLGWASNLKTVSSDDMKQALQLSLDTKLPIEQTVLSVVAASNNADAVPVAS